MQNTDTVGIVREVNGIATVNHQDGRVEFLKTGTQLAQGDLINKLGGDVFLNINYLNNLTDVQLLGEQITLTNGETPAIVAPDEDLETLITQQLLNLGMDPTAILDAAAAGETTSGSEGGQSFVFIPPNYGSSLVTAGYLTTYVSLLGGGEQTPEGFTYLNQFDEAEPILPPEITILPEINVSAFQVSELNLPNGSQPESGLLTANRQVSVTAGSNDIQSVQLSITAQTYRFIDQDFAITEQDGMVEFLLIDPNSADNGNPLLTLSLRGDGQPHEAGETKSYEFDIELDSNLLAKTGINTPVFVTSMI